MNIKKNWKKVKESQDKLSLYFPFSASTAFNLNLQEEKIIAQKENDEAIMKAKRETDEIIRKLNQQKEGNCLMNNKNMQNYKKGISR